MMFEFLMSRYTFIFLGQPRRLMTMDLSSFEHDIDELIEEFVMEGSTTFAAMKRVWLSKKFSYIYEARPSTNFLLYAVIIYTYGHMINTTSLLQRLAGLYCLYCLCETQPLRPPVKIYISIRELKWLKELVVEAREKDIKVVHVLIKSMLKMNLFLFGYVDLNEGSNMETLNQLTEVQNARIHVAYENYVLNMFFPCCILCHLNSHLDFSSYIVAYRFSFSLLIGRLLNNTKIEDFLNMDLGTEVDLAVLKKMSTEYTDAKKLAIKEANEVVDVQNMQHISDDEELIGVVVENISENWNASRHLFYEQTGQMALEVRRQPVPHEDQEYGGFDVELELLLSQT
ncbi:hypothetical protein HS088_TW14G00712 [Tripterygium wilfordii]|uniref:Uncharacterized protein n=1 Tax=Tripterygium wilfordii TaxID=458696 RepID=A0A7J7CR47_TRIWF|nr:hypothetical protein HS088_TW14G00712 [Tripterygium wilfordii]